MAFELILGLVWISLCLLYAVRIARSLYDRPGSYRRTAQGSVSACSIEKWEDEGSFSFDLFLTVSYSVDGTLYSTSRYYFYAVPRKQGGPYLYESDLKEHEARALSLEMKGKSVLLHYDETKPWRGFVILNRPWGLVVQQVLVVLFACLGLFFFYRAFSP